jgi:hypothetical protein
MKNRSKLVVIASALLLVVAPALAADTADVTGTWKMTVELSMGTFNPTFTMVQKGEEITGDYKGQLGEAPISGTIKGNDIAISFKTSMEGQELKVEYIGVVEGDTMKGKVVFGEYGEGTFAGVREHPPQQ